MLYRFDNVMSDSYWTEWGADQDDPDDLPIPIIPGITADEVEEIDPLWREEYDSLEDAISDLDDDRQEQFWPLMNYAWPVKIYPDDDLMKIAGRVREWAGCVTLMDVSPGGRFGKEMAFGLTGGGMDLSWNLCAAYVAAGQIPPAELLRGLPTMAGRPYGAEVSEVAAREILECAHEAARFLENMGHRIREVAREKKDIGGHAKGGA